jgi:threonylcarbamoyladenosine tRNA methylthiotransferase MtaB
MTKKFLIETFGCRLNQYESQLLREQLTVAGFQEAVEGVDYCLVHSCSVTASAEKSCKSRVLALCKKYPLARMVVFGCFARRDGKALLAIDPRVEVFSEKGNEKLLSFLTGSQGDICEKNHISYFQGHTRAFVKIQDGCSNGCSYCVIPQLRGPSTSRSVEQIVEEVGALVGQGYKEVVLTGVNIGEYRYGLPTLIRAIDTMTQVKRLRLSSIEPNHVDGELIAAILEGRSTMPHLHMVLQSGSNEILKKMRRSLTRELFLEKVEAIQKRRSDFCFSTDVIVGFPSETEKDFLQTIDLVEAVDFAKVHIFPYSKRPKTIAARMPEPVAEDVIQRRRKKLSAIAEKAAFRQREKFVGKDVDVLLEGNGDEGYTPQYLPIRLPAFSGKPNEIVSVRILENQKNHLVGTIL